MKIQKPNSKDIGTGVASVLGATAGFMLPNGIANAVAKVDNEAVISEDQKKTKMYVNLACMVGGVLLAVAVKGDDMVANATRGASLGLAGGGARGLVTHFAKDNVTTTAGTTSGRFVAGALGCACTGTDYPALMRPRLRMPVLENATFVENPTIVNADPLG